MRIAWEGRELYCHISTKAGFDPVKTLYVCAPGADAASYEAAARFAQASGWREIAEQDGAVLVLPIVPHGWRAEDAGLLMEIYRGTRGSFPTQSGKSLYGRGGYLWCWETLIYAVGYEDGASFLGDASAACPSFFAAAALVGGVPQDYTPGERPSSHWLVENVSADYKTLNRELPVCLWLMVRERQEADAAVRYFNRSNGAQGPGCEEMFDDISATVYRAPDGGAAQVRISTGTFGPEPALARTVFSQLFERVIRWKNGPDGKLTPFMSRADFYASPRFALDSVVYGGRSYGFFVHVPEGLTAEQARRIGGRLPRGLIAYGRLPLMLTRNCPNRNGAGCSGCGEASSLKDRKGVSFPMICDHICTQILNSVPLEMEDRKSDFSGMDFTVLRFTVENSVESEEKFHAFHSGQAPKDGFTRGLYYRGVD